MILVDSSIWVRALRRGDSPERRELDALLDADQVAITDVVAAEVLQGAGSEEEFEEFAGRLDALHYFHADEALWLRAARLSFDLKRQGMTTALSDVVVAAVALENDLEVYSIDSDFQRIPGLRLYQVRT
jgi:predicted nucleic acid-binding protein